MKTYEVLKDTKIVEENTKDSLQVKVSEEVSHEGEIELEGKIVKGDNLTITNVSYVNLGDLKTSLEKINAKILELQAQKVEIENLISEIEPELDTAIVDILKDPTAEDRRIIREVEELVV